MNAFSVTPLKAPTFATLRMPGSKSYTNRALILAALTHGPVCLHHPLYSDDTEAMAGCLHTLGLQMELKPDAIIVHNDIRDIQDQTYQLYAHESGTTARFILALACIIPGIKTIQGSQRLQERPIQDLVDALQELGARIEYGDRMGHLPVKVWTSSLSGHSVHLKGDISSQFCSAILLISPYLPTGLTVYMTSPLISKPYVEMTLSCMKEWGVTVMVQANGHYVVQERQRYDRQHYVIEADFSSAGYFFAMAVLTRSTMIVDQINPHSMQADRKWLDILAKMGNRVVYEADRICIQGTALLAMDVDMEECPDQVMTMAVLAAFARGVTHISGVRSLRVKETERVVALQTELQKMGIHTESTWNTLTIYGGRPHAAEIDTYNDHRIAMAFAMAGLVVPGIVIRRPEVVKKTFPTFWKLLQSL